MLTLAKVATGAAAAGYYENSNDYYHKGRDPSQWQGAGAERLGLSGEVDASTFRNLLDGKLLDGRQIHNAATGRLGGIDFTFSAPKSISMQGLIGGDVRLIEAHDKAVAKALRYAESLSAYRITQADVTRREMSGNLVVAMFRHDLSRAKDPNLHTHAVVLNATQRPDGEWRALHHAEFFKQKMLMGALYRAELALLVRELGYEIRLTHADGRFELSQISQQQIAAFSTRSKQIEAALAARGMTRDDSSAHAKQAANLATRSAKTEVDKQRLHDDWMARSAAHGVDYSQPRKEILVEASAKAQDARVAITFALEHATERQSVVSLPTVLRHALERGTGSTDFDNVKRELVEYGSSGYLVVNGERCTTEAAQQRERELLDVVSRGRGSVKSITDERSVTAFLSTTTLNDGQRAAATLILSTADRVVAIQGAAGTGKTTMLERTSAYAIKHGFRPCGVAPSSAAARELAKSGIPSHTVASFLKEQKHLIGERTVLVVDESGMVSAKDMHGILHAAEKAGARVVLVGDTQQLKAVEAGRPFAQIQHAGVARVEMGEIQRQHDARLRQAVALAYAGYMRQSVAILERNIVEIADTSERHAAIAHDYARLDPAARSNVIIVSGTRHNVASINKEVREALGLSGKGHETSILVPKDLSRAQARMSLSYQAGDVVQATRTFARLGMKPGDLAQVVECSNGTVTLSRGEKQVQWRPAIQTNMVAYEGSSREFSVGDQVRATANDRASGLINGERAKVVEIIEKCKTIKLKTSAGKIVELNAERPLHLDHAYCSTVHAAQGLTCRSVLIDADTTSATSNESLFYTAISRAQDSVTIYTDDKQSLPETMSREDVKHAALDLPRSKTDALEL